MSLTDLFVGADCGVDIYEEQSEDKWVECSVRIAKIGAVISVPIIIVVMLVLIYFGDTMTRVLTVIIGCGLIALIIAYPFLIAPGASRIQFQRFQKELGSRMSSGMSREQAIRELQKERLSREKIAAINASANRQQVYYR